MTRSLPEAEAIAAALVASAPHDESRVLHVAGDEFRLDAEPPVDLSRRAALRRVMHVLVERHDVPLSVDEAFAVGWPGERARPDSAARRVYTALWNLRKLGFDAILVRDEDGYRIASSVRIETS